MKIRDLLALVLLGAAGVVGCGGAKDQDTSAGAAGASASGSKYDAGPRAAEEPVDPALAERGEALFKEKGCSACHAFGTRLSGPDLGGVAGRRTSAWIESTYSTLSLVGLVSSKRRLHWPSKSAASPKLRQIDLACPMCR